MKPEKRKALEAAGWKFGDVADFLEMTDDERQLLATRIELARAIRNRREVLHLSQKDLAARLKTSQPRVAKIEQAAPDVSLDQIYRAYAAVGGQMVIKAPKADSPKTAESTSAPRKRKRKMSA